MSGNDELFYVLSISCRFSFSKCFNTFENKTEKPKTRLEIKIYPQLMDNPQHSIEEIWKKRFP